MHFEHATRFGGASRLTLFMLFALLSALLPAAGSSASEPCPNEAFRTGLSTTLPDCRAYEAVTPSDANGRRFFDITGFLLYDLFPTELADPFRDSFVFSILDDPLQSPAEGAGNVDIYEAERTAVGWSTVRRLSPSGSQAVNSEAGGVDADHRYTFTHVRKAEKEFGSLAAEGDADYLGNSDGSFELTGVGSLGSTRQAQGLYISPGGDHVIFTTGGAWCESPGTTCKKIQLEPNAPPTGTAAIYDRGPDGPTKVVSLLPGNIPPAGGEDAEYEGASYDGTVVAFTIGGTLYVRIDNEETKKVTEEASTYAGLSSDGRYLFYVCAGNINRFDTTSGISQPVNSSGDAQIVNVSSDGSHVYFISESQLDGAEGSAGEPNMYVWDGAAIDYIATVLPSDLEGTSGEVGHEAGLARWTSWAVNPDRRGVSGEGGRGPGADSSRTTPDGSVLVFESRAPLTSYANAGHTEIYRYDDISGDLSCVSCSSLASPPTSDARLQELKTAHPPTVIHNLSVDGTRVFFETSDPLVERDTDGINDIYEWEKPVGATLPTVDLISSGHSVAYPPQVASGLPIPMPNVLMGVTPQGNDVFFLSEDALTAGAGSGGTSAIYDARVGGGFPEPAPVSACDDPAACHPSQVSPPALAAPQSSRRTKGNVKHRCRRGKRGTTHRHHRGRCHRRHHKKGHAR